MAALYEPRASEPTLLSLDQPFQRPNIAIAAWKRLEPSLAELKSTRLRRVRVYETPEIFAEYGGKHEGILRPPFFSAQATGSTPTRCRKKRIASRTVSAITPMATDITTL